MFKFTPRVLLIALLCALTALTACKTTTLHRKSLASYNYEAVDGLLNRAGKRITTETPMLVGTIGDVNNVETSSTLGRAITEQLSARLANRGYKVAELKLRQGISIQHGGLNPANSGEYLLSRDVAEISGQHKAAAALSGTYSAGAENVLVNLRLIDIRTGELIAAYDYVLPKTPDIIAMLGTGNAAGVGSFFQGAGSFF